MDDLYHAPEQLPAWGTLKSLSERPFNLNSPNALTAARIAAFTCHTAGFKLLYATQRVDENTLTALQQLADQSEVIGQFLRMKRGAIMNRIVGWPSENRQVLHTASRDLFRPVPDHPEATQQARKECSKLKMFLDMSAKDDYVI